MMSIPHGSGSSIHLQVKMLDVVKFSTYTETSFELGNCLYIFLSRNICLVHSFLKTQETVKLEPKRTSLPVLELTVHTVPPCAPAARMKHNMTRSEHVHSEDIELSAEDHKLTRPSLPMGQKCSVWPFVLMVGFNGAVEPSSAISSLSS